MDEEMSERMPWEAKGQFKTIIVNNVGDRVALCMSPDDAAFIVQATKSYKELEGGEINYTGPPKVPEVTIRFSKLLPHAADVLTVNEAMANTNLRFGKNAGKAYFLCSRCKAWAYKIDITDIKDFTHEDTCPVKLAQKLMEVIRG